MGERTAIELPKKEWRKRRDDRWGKKCERRKELSDNAEGSTEL